MMFIQKPSSWGLKHVLNFRFAKMFDSHGSLGVFLWTAPSCCDLDFSKSGSKEVCHSSVASKAVPCSITMLPLPIPGFGLIWPATARLMTSLFPIPPSPPSCGAGFTHCSDILFIWWERYLGVKESLMCGPIERGRIVALQVSLLKAMGST